MSLLAPSEGRAQKECILPITTRAWPAPLDQRLSLQESTLRLRDALDRLSAASGVQLTYANDVVPLDRAVCASFRSIALGDALSSWLHGRAEPVAVGAMQVVLAPAREATPPAGAPRAARPPVDLEPVVVVAPAGRNDAGGTTSSDVIRREQLDDTRARSLADILDGVIPAGWLWSGGPTSLAASGTIRGASSFGVSYPKIFIDGVEVANPLLLTRLAPESLEEIEVIRGPQGTALYGSDAIAGVINIRTRTRGDGGGGQGRWQLTSSAGHAGSAYASLGALVQDHTISARLGSPLRSFVSSISAASIGGYVPGAFSRQLSASAGMSLVGERTRVQSSARFHSQRSRDGYERLVAGIPALAAGTGVTSAATFTDAQRVASYTVGAQVTHVRDARWTHTVVAGLDGYALQGVAPSALTRLSPSDSALLAATGRGDRGTLRVTSAARFGEEGRRSAVLTLGVDHSLFRDAAERGAAEEFFTGSQPVWRASFGAIGQAQMEFARTLFFNAGLRLEHSTGFIAQDIAAALPSLGVAFARDAGPIGVKLRAAYGKAIRAPREASYRLASTLTPEQQDGVEFGADLTVGRHLGLRITRFDQRARGLVQPVLGSVPILSSLGLPEERQLLTLQNVGEIANRGWEFQANGTLGPLQLTGALGLVDSRVVHVAPGYTGDLRAGDRMLQVPSLTTSLSATWTGAGWAAMVGAARASDWINYDWLAYGRTERGQSDTTARQAPASLRSYWLTYAGVSRLRANYSRELTRGLTLVLTGENLLGIQRGEPDNATVTPGRTLTGGLRARF